MKQQQATKELDWLIKRKDFISINKIEKELGMSQGTLKKFVEGKRGLAEQWHDPVREWVKQFKKL